VSKADDFVAAARGELGKAYWAHRDCSGLTAWAGRQVGLYLPEGSEAQWAAGAPVAQRTQDDLHPGDLVFWNTPTGHVGIYEGDGWVINALNESAGIVRTSLNGSYGGSYRGARRIFPDAPPKDDGGVGAALTPVTPRSSWRDLGSVSFEDFELALARSLTPGFHPMLDEARSIYDVLTQRGLARLGGAMAWTERSNDTNPDGLQYYPRSYHNAWAVKANGRFVSYPNYTEAAKAWVDRVLGAGYADLTRLEDFIARYAPRNDGNPADYAQRIANQINENFPLSEEEPPVDPQNYTDWPVEGSTKKLRLPRGLEFMVQLTAPGIINHAVGRPNRTQRPLRWGGTTQHTTNNVGRGNGAQMHANWQSRGTPDHPDGVIAVHFYVDDTVVIQCLPIDEQGIHSGDDRNGTQTAVELCVNADRNASKAEANAIALQAGLLRILGGNAVSNLYPHTKNASGHCPRLSVSWATWEQLVDAELSRMRSGTTPEDPPKPAPVFTGLPSWLPAEHFKAAFPLADPAGSVTREVIAWTVEFGQILWFEEKVDVGPRQNLWRFDGATFLSDGNTVWREGRAKPS
jgi:hypothetical protein